MKKFRTVLKTKQRNHDLVQEKKILLGFKKVYNSLLEKYGTSSFHDLNESNRPAFLAELNSYWSEDKGLLKKGKEFLRGNTDMLNESSTPAQKKIYMKKRITPLISETLRQSNLKWKMYDVLNEVYKSTKSKNLSDVLPANEILDTVLESFQLSLRSFMEEIDYELKENSKS